MCTHRADIFHYAYRSAHHRVHRASGRHDNLSPPANDKAGRCACLASRGGIAAVHGVVGHFFFPTSPAPTRSGCLVSSRIGIDLIGHFHSEIEKLDDRRAFFLMCVRTVDRCHVQDICRLCRPELQWIRRRSGGLSVGEVECDGKPQITSCPPGTLTARLRRVAQRTSDPRHGNP